MCRTRSATAASYISSGTTVGGVSDRKNAWRFEHMLGDKYSFSNENPNPAALTLPENMLFAWAHAHPDTAPAFLAVIVPALTSRNPEAGNQTWHPMMKRLLNEFGDREDVLRAITRNMYTFGWTGSRTTYFALYSGPLRELQSHPIGAVRRGLPAPSPQCSGAQRSRNRVNVAGCRCYRASSPVRPRWDQAVPCCSPLTGWALGPVAASRPSRLAAALSYLTEGGRVPLGSVDWQ
jgi:hypothetical protein